jgi:adenosine deaminase
MTEHETILAMPKTELHIHLEGTISPETLWSLSRRNGVALPVASLEALRGMYEFEDFDKFIKTWLAMCSCLKADRDYEEMVEGWALECERQNIRYAELHFTPYNHEKFGIGGERALDIVARRLMEAEALGGPVARLILDIPSEAAPESGEYTVSLLERLENPIVVAMGLGGPEKGYPRSDFAKYFERARRAGYPVVAHAGETGGPEHVRQAVLELGARRVQHGVAAVEDASVLSLLAQRRVCCDVALTSNAYLTPYADISRHPIKRMIAARVPVTISTDDPPFFGTDLIREYERARSEVGLDLRSLWEINLNGLRYGLADVATRRRLMREFQAAGRELGLGSE